MVKICDFGFAKRVHMPQSLTTLCGSLFYVAPELLKNHPYDESADMWSVGVIIFFLLAGYLVSCNWCSVWKKNKLDSAAPSLINEQTPHSGRQPFHHRDHNELFQIIRLGRYSFDKKYWAGISNEATTLIMHLLDVDPSTRYTSTRALHSDWIKKAEQSTLFENNLANSLTGISIEATRLKGVAKPVQWISKSRNLSSLTADGVDFHSLSHLSTLC